MSLASQVAAMATRVGQEFKARAPKSARFYHNTTVSISNASALVPLDVLDYNDDATIFQAVSSGMKLLKAGLYSIDFTALASTPTAYSSVFVQKNSATVFESGGTYPAGTQRITGTFKMRLAANDLLTLNGYSSGAFSLQGNGSSYNLGLTATFLGI